MKLKVFSLVLYIGWNIPIIIGITGNILIWTLMYQNEIKMKNIKEIKKKEVKAITLRKLSTKSIENIEQVMNDKLLKNKTDAVDYILSVYNCKNKEKAIKRLTKHCEELEKELILIKQAHIHLNKEISKDLPIFSNDLYIVHKKSTRCIS